MCMLMQRLRGNVHADGEAEDQHADGKAGGSVHLPDLYMSPACMHGMMPTSCGALFMV